jgi:YVTN family beta-propeller protein
MSQIIFGGSVSMIDTATPSTGWVVAYDVDGILKQKNEFGFITQIGQKPTLAEVLNIGNTTDTLPIIMGNSTYIGSSNGDASIRLDYAGATNSILISTDGTVGGEQGIILQNDYSSIFANNGKQRIDVENGSGDIAVYNFSSGSILFGVGTNPTYDEVDEIKISYNLTSTASTGNNDKQSVLIGTRNSQIAPGIVNTVVIGGSNILATQSNSIYTPDIYLQSQKSLRSVNSNNILILNDTNGDVIIDKSLGSKDNSWFRMSESEPGYNYWTEIKVNSSDTLGLTSGMHIGLVDTFLSNNITSIKFEKTELSLLTNGTNNINLKLNTSSNTLKVEGSGNFPGIEYNSDFSASYSIRSLVDKNYVDTKISSLSVPNISQVLGIGNNTGTRNLIMGTSTYIKSVNGGGRIDLDFGAIANRVLISTDDSVQSTYYIDLNGPNIDLQTSLLKMTLNDSNIITSNSQGLKYNSNYSSTFVSRSLVDKQYVDTGTSSIWNRISNIVAGTGSQNYIPYWSSNNVISQTSSLYVSGQSTKYTILNTVSVGTTPYFSKVSSTNHKLYVANYNSNDVTIFNTKTNLIIATVSVGTNPTEIAIDETNGLVWVSNRGSNSVTYINLTTNAVVGTINVGSNPYGIEKIGNYIYVANQSSNNISIIDTSTNTISATISITTPRSFTWDFNLNNLWVTGIGPDYVGVVDLSTNLLVGSISVGVNPYDIEYNPNNRYVYVTNNSSNNVSVIDSVSQLVIATVSVGTNPNGIKLEDIEGGVFVTNTGSGNISVINQSNTVISTFIVSGQPRGIEYNIDDAKLYVSNGSLNSLQVIETLDRQFGYLGVDTQTAKSELDIDGKLTTNKLRIVNGAAANYVLTSDSAGNASWKQPIIELSSGSGLIGGGTSGYISVSVDFSVVASKSYVDSGTSSIWTAINSVNNDYVSEIVAGTGLNGGGTFGTVTLGVNVDNGLSLVSDNVVLGGTLSQNTVINLDGNYISFYRPELEVVIDPNEFSVFASDNSSPGTPTTFLGITGSIFNIKSSTGNVGEINELILSTYDQSINDGSSDNSIILKDNTNYKGIVYYDDYSPNFTTYSLVTKGYVDSQVATSTFKYSITRGFTASITETITHSLGTNEVIVQCYDSSGIQVIPGTVQINGLNAVDITFSSTLSNIKTIVIG